MAVVAKRGRPIMMIVAAVAGHRLERVGDTHDPSAQRDRGTGANEG
jgi:hypothetical protein